MKRRSFLGFLLGAPAAIKLAVTAEAVPQQHTVRGPTGSPGLVGVSGSGQDFAGCSYITANGAALDDKVGLDGQFAMTSDYSIWLKANGKWMPHSQPMAAQVTV